MSENEDPEKSPEEGKKKTTKSKKPIRLRLNYRTVVTVRSDAALKAWLERYPDAQILDS